MTGRSTTVILYCNFEELAALNAAAARSMDAQAEAWGVVAPPEAIEDVEALLPRLVGDIGVESLADHASIRRAVAFLTDELRDRMNHAVIEQHPAAEDAVLAYFEYAHSLSVLRRLDRLGDDMIALAELMTGERAGSESAQRFTFPDA